MLAVRTPEASRPTRRIAVPRCCLPRRGIGSATSITFDFAALPCGSGLSLRSLAFRPVTFLSTLRSGCYQTPRKTRYTAAWLRLCRGRHFRRLNSTPLQGATPARPDVTVAPSSGFPQPIRPSPRADEWSRAASAHPPFQFLFSQAGAALHLDSGSFTGVTHQLMSLSIHRDGCPGRYPRPWATTTALSPYRTPERACSRRSRSYTDRRGDVGRVLRSPVVSLTGSGPRPLGRGMEGVPWSDVAIDPIAVNRLNHRCGCANTRSHGWSSGSLALTHHVLR